MAVNCSPASLVADSSCLCSIPKSVENQVILYVLAVIRGGSLDPKVLLAEAASNGFLALSDPRQIEAMKVVALCAIATKLGA